VHAGVGAAGAGGGQRHRGEFQQRLLQLVLHGQAVVLLLVAVPGLAVVLKPDCDPFHLLPNV
jgi:hypothetical protein